MGMTVEEKNKFMDESKERFKEWHDMNYISKSDYESRLKADMVAMLTEIQLEIEELKKEPAHCHHFERGIRFSSDIIQQKIDALKERTEGNDD